MISTTLNNHGQNNSPSSRRQFIRRSAQVATVASTALTLNPVSAAALTGFGDTQTVAKSSKPDRRLRLVNAHTWEKLDIVFWTQGVYIDESLEQINYLMRDHRANAATQMDRKLIDDLHNLYQLMNTEERIHILSGYRTPATNAKLRKRSPGVAKYSLHMEGRAVDLNIPGRSARDIKKAALSMKAGGVGYYASSGFVHIDTGNVRHWGSS